MVDYSTVIYWTSLFVILGLSGLFCRFYYIFDENPVSTDKTHHYVASDLVLQCLLTTILRVSRLDCVNLQVGMELRVYQIC